MSKANKFKTYKQYLNDKDALLQDKNDIQLTAINKISSDSELLQVRLQEIYDNYGYLTNFQSAEKLKIKFNEFGWKNLERMSTGLIDSCERAKEYEICLKKIEEMTLFVFQSNLSEEHKLDVTSELDYYKLQTQSVFKFNSKYEERFNSLVEKYNNEVHQISLVKKPVVLTKDSIQSSFLKTENLPRFNGEFYFQVLIALLFFAILLVSRKMKSIKFRKNYYSSFFKISPVSGLQVRMFGIISTKAIKKLSKFSKDLIVIFSRKKLFFGELHFRFKENANVIKLETCLYSKDPIQVYYDETSGETSSKFKKLVSDIEEAGGEVILSTQFDGAGNIVSSKFDIYLPA